VLYPDGYRLVLIYTEQAFYLWNPGSRTLQVSSIDFEALDDASGAATNYRFRGRQWAEIFREVMPDNCAALELMDYGHFNRPRDCAGYNVVRTPPQTSEQVFWLPRDGISVPCARDDQEAVRCAVGEGRASLYSIGAVPISYRPGLVWNG
jgi:hypothetical protein